MTNVGSMGFVAMSVESVERMKEEKPKKHGICRYSAKILLKKHAKLRETRLKMMN